MPPVPQDVLFQYVNFDIILLLKPRMQMSTKKVLFPYCIIKKESSNNKTKGDWIQQQQNPIGQLFVCFFIHHFLTN